MIRKTKGSSFLDLIIVLLKRRRLIVLSTVIAAALATLFSLYTMEMPSGSRLNPLPDKYTSETQLLMVGYRNKSFGAGFPSAVSENNLDLAASVEGAGSIRAGEAAGSASDIPINPNFVRAVVDGDYIAEDVARHFRFARRYHINRNTRTLTREIFRNALSTTYDDASGVLTIRYTDVDRYLATDVLAYTLSALQHRIEALSSQRVDFLKNNAEKRLDKIEKRLVEAQDRLVGFQVKHGIIDPQFEARYRAAEIINLAEEIDSKEMQLQNLHRHGRNARDPRVLQLNIGIAVLQQMLDELRSGSAGLGTNTLMRGNVAKMSMEYHELDQDMALQDAVYVFVKGQYEIARSELVAAEKTFEIVEPPQVPEVKSGPNRAVISVAVTASVFVLAVLFSILMERFEGVKGLPASSRESHRRA